MMMDTTGTQSLNTPWTVSDSSWNLKTFDTALQEGHSYSRYRIFPNTSVTPGGMTCLLYGIVSSASLRLLQPFQHPLLVLRLLADEHKTRFIPGIMLKTV